MTRFQATIYYRMDKGVIGIVHDLAELSDLDEIVERGPHWDTIHNIAIVRVNHVDSKSLTVEEAEKL